MELDSILTVFILSHDSTRGGEESAIRESIYCDFDVTVQCRATREVAGLRRNNYEEPASRPLAKPILHGGEHVAIQRWLIAEL